MIDGIMISFFGVTAADQQYVRLISNEDQEDQGRNGQDQDGERVLRKGFRSHHKNGKHANEGPAQVGFMSYVILFGTDAVNGVYHENNSVSPGGDMDRKQKQPDTHI